jgi:hypothetical protein
VGIYTCGADYGTKAQLVYFVCFKIEARTFCSNFKYHDGVYCTKSFCSPTNTKVDFLAARSQVFLIQEKSARKVQRPALIAFLWSFQIQIESRRRRALDI